MGQCVTALVYGVECEHENPLTDKDGEWLSGKPEGLKIETGGGNSDFVCIGLTLAVHRQAEDGEVDLPEGPVFKLKTTLAEEIAAAKDDWKMIVRWAASHGVKLPRPELMLVEIERA